jgi:V/A-type H+-transporting ATPase subunit D
MKLNVNPNRMELLRLRRRLVLAERGHKLLKDKLEEIMRRFLEIMRRLYDIQSGIAPEWNKALLSFGFVRAGSPSHEWERLLPEGELLLDVREEKVFNLSIPKFSIESMAVADYDLLNTEGELDVGIKKMQDMMEDLLEMARLWKAVELLSREIEVTRRRVNALEHILIPSIKETIHYISNRLEEMERSHQVQLMRVKEIVRSH